MELRYKQYREEGFTLVELLVVILIIGVLSAIAIPAYLNQRKVAHDKTVESDIKNIAVAIQTLPADATRIAKMSTAAKDEKSVANLSYFNKGKLNLEPIATTAGVWWTVTGSSEKYCIVGYHKGGNDYTRNKPLTYDSTAGGLGKVGDACNPADVLDENGQIVATGNLAEDPTLTNVNVPSFQINTVNNVSSYFATPFRTVETETPIGNKAIEFSAEDLTRAQGVMFYQPKTDKAVPIAKAGERWTVSLYVKAPAGTEMNMSARITDIRNAGGYVSEYSKMHIATGEWQRMSYLYIAPASEIGYYVQAQIKTRTTNTVQGLKVQATAPMIERSPTLNPFRVD